MREGITNARAGERKAPRVIDLDGSGTATETAARHALADRLTPAALASLAAAPRVLLDVCPLFEGARSFSAFFTAFGIPFCASFRLSFASA